MADLRSGRKQDGRFAKGRSGNPGGRPQKTPELLKVENLCRQHAVTAVERLAHWMQSDDARPSIAACTGILERAFGRPRQPLEHAGKDGGPIETHQTDFATMAASLSTSDRKALQQTLEKARDILRAAREA